MKNHMKKWVSVSLVLLLFLMLLPATVGATVGENEPYQEETTFPYVDEDGFKNYSASDNLLKNQLTEDELNLETELLLNLVLESKVIKQMIVCANGLDYSIYYRSVSEQFNGLQELESRDDAGNIIAQRYISEMQDEHWNQYDGIDFERIALEIFIQQEVFSSKISNDNMENILNYQEEIDISDDREGLYSAESLSLCWLVLCSKWLRNYC